MKRRKFNVKEIPAKTAGGLDDRIPMATPLRSVLNKVFPDHWSFLLGEIALFSFIMLLLTGTFLALFFDPSMEEVKYQGSYLPLRDVQMSRAYETALNLSFDVRGGLIHAPDATTGRRCCSWPRSWCTWRESSSPAPSASRVSSTGCSACSLFWIGFTEGFAGYSLPDDALSAPACASPRRSYCRSRWRARG
jgi:ubiquinol-cytochrome c reductase cytochrome b subunit